MESNENPFISIQKKEISWQRQVKTERNYALGFPNKKNHKIDENLYKKRKKKPNLWECWKLLKKEEKKIFKKMNTFRILNEKCW